MLYEQMKINYTQMKEIRALHNKKNSTRDDSEPI